MPGEGGEGQSHETVAINRRQRLVGLAPDIGGVDVTVTASDDKRNPKFIDKDECLNWSRFATSSTCQEVVLRECHVTSSGTKGSRSACSSCSHVGNGYLFSRLLLKQGLRGVYWGGGGSRWP